MTDSYDSEITRLLSSLKSDGAGPHTITNRLLEAVYDELRGMAGGFLRGERPDHTLRPTALVHEAYEKLVDQTRVEWQGRAHFLGVAAQSMRRILVDHARRRGAAKRGGDWQRMPMEALDGVANASSVDILDLDDALARFAAEDPRAARVVELRFFGGMTGREIAHVLEVSPRTIDEDWAVAKMWLSRALGPDA